MYLSSAFSTILKELDSPKVTYSETPYTELEYLSMFKTAQLSVPRCSGKTRFLLKTLRRGDLLVVSGQSDKVRTLKELSHLHKSSNPVCSNIEVKTVGEVLNASSLPCRYLFLDEVEISPEIVLNLYNLGYINTETSILSLLTKEPR